MLFEVLLVLLWFWSA